MEAQEIPGAVPISIWKAGPHARLNWMNLLLFGLQSARLPRRAPQFAETPKDKAEGKKKDSTRVIENK